MKQEPHRMYTIFRNMTFAVTLLVIFGEFKLMALSVAILLPAAAVALALIFPVRQDKPIAALAKLFFGAFGCLGILLMIVAVFVFSISGVMEGLQLQEEDRGDIDAEFTTYSDLTSQRSGRLGMRISEVFPLDAIIPSEASKIHFWGRGGGLLPIGDFAEFSCTVTEADFMKFAQTRGYLLATNRILGLAAPAWGFS